jgi:ribose 5-phosphate isomerase B
MKISIAADHAGVELKKQLREMLAGEGHQLVDHGTDSTASVDYPDFAVMVAHDVVNGTAERGILVCGTGIGMAIAANKVSGIRAAVATNAEEIALSRSHNDANVLSVGARFTAPDEAVKMVHAFLSTPFEGGRHVRRLEKISQIEKEESK